MIYSLQSLRAIAAILVVLSHVIDTMKPYFDPSPLYISYWGFGKGGVQLFFVLSGFIIHHIHQREANQPRLAPNYLKRRLSRIVPLYWVINLVLAPMWLLSLTSEPYHSEVSALLTSMFFIPHPDRLPNLHVGWTLIHEMLFYLFFVAFFFTKRFSWIAIGWALSIVVYQLFFVQSNWIADFIFNENNILFLAGMLISVVWKKSDEMMKNGPLLFAIGTVIFVAGSMMFHFGILGRDRMFVWFFGLGSICLILAAQNSRVEAFFKRRKTLNFLGDASYSIYLTHAPILAVAAKLITKWNDSFFIVPNFVTWVMLIIIVLVAGSACYLIVEKPLIRFFKRRIKG